MWSHPPILFCLFFFKSLDQEKKALLDDRLNSLASCRSCQPYRNNLGQSVLLQQDGQAA